MRGLRSIWYSGLRSNTSLPDPGLPPFTMYPPPLSTNRADRGGIDFDGRARWDAWKAVAGMDADKAKTRFVKLYYEFSPTALYKDARGSA